MDESTHASIVEAVDRSERRPTRWSRRTFLRGAAAAGAGAFALQGIAPALAQQQTPGAAGQTDQDGDGQSTDSSAATTPPRFRTYPIPGTRTASPFTEISFRGPQPHPIGSLTVVGSQTGNRPGVLIPHNDGYGASFVPDASFRPGEQVTVTTGLDIRNGTNGVFQFTIADPIVPQLATSTRKATSQKDRQTYHSRPDLTPPIIKMTKAGGSTADGYILTSPKTVESQNGAMIMDDDGEVVWFAPVSDPAESINDFRLQHYRGRPVLTYWQGIVVAPPGYGLGHVEVINQSYESIASVRVGNGYQGNDLHDFMITPQDTALFTVYNQVHWDLSAAGGSPDGIAVDNIVQEVDIETGRVLFEWHSLDHVALNESYVAPSGDNTAAYDYFHLNSVDVDQEGNLILSGRHTCAIYKVDHRSGEILWRLNGKASNFQMGAGTVTAFQHDVQSLQNGNLTIFDNSADNNKTQAPGVAKSSRGVIMAVDYQQMTTALVAEYRHPGQLLAQSQGSTQLLPNGNVFIGWGDQPYFSEFSSDGSLLLDGQFPDKEYSYRAYRSPWTGYPKDRPAVATSTDGSGKLTLYASWNGATEVAKWEVLTGTEANQLTMTASAPRSGFETAIALDQPAAVIAVRARNKDGEVIGTSKAIQPTT